MPKYLIDANFNPQSVKEFRKNFKMSQYALAKWLDCTPNTIACWEQGRGMPHGVYIYKMVRKCIDVKLEIPEFYLN